MKTKLALVAALVLATGSSALALDGYDSDNNRIPGAAQVTVQTAAPAIYAQAHGRVAPKTVTVTRSEKIQFDRAQGLAE